MAETPDETRITVDPQRGVAGERAVLSLLVPGLGQFAQRRFLTGAGQLGTVLSYVGVAMALGGGRALVLAVAFNLWSAIDAYRHDRT